MRPVFLFIFYFHLSYLHLRSELVLLISVDKLLY